MATIQTRARSIKRQAGRTKNAKKNTVTINHDDFWKIMTYAVNLEQFDLFERNRELIHDIRRYRGMLHEIAESDSPFAERINLILDWKGEPE